LVLISISLFIFLLVFASRLQSWRINSIFTAHEWLVSVRCIPGVEKFS
jgi:hypothetical protein